MKADDNRGIFKHLALLIDENYRIRQVIENTDGVPSISREKDTGKKCHKYLWGLDAPCSECPFKSLSAHHQGSIISHFRQGVTGLTSEVVSESLIAFQDESFIAIILIEPLIKIIEDEKNKSLLAYGYSRGGDGGGKSDDSFVGEHPNIEEHLTSLFYRQKYTHLLSGFKLSPTELMVAIYVLRGIPSKEIAFRMSISKKSVDFHRTNIRQKMGITGCKTSISAFLLKEDSKQER